VALPVWVRWVAPVLLAVDVVAVLVLVSIAVIGTDDDGRYASPI
jgi:hypothetical protein